MNKEFVISASQLSDLLINKKLVIKSIYGFDDDNTTIILGD